MTSTNRDKNYVLMCYVTKGDEEIRYFIGIDQSSGGYPFHTEVLNSAAIWNDRTELISYMNMFHDQCERENWYVMDVQLHRCF